MPLSPETTRVLYSDPNTGLSLEDQLTAAYERNLAAGQAVVEVTTTLADVAAAAAAEATSLAAEAGCLPELSKEFTSTAETSRFANSEVFAALGLETPSLGELAAAGIDFLKLETAHKTLEHLGHEPSLVIAPLLPAEDWKTVFQTLQDNPRVNHDNRIKEGGLYIDDSIETNWDQLNDSPHTVTVNGQGWQVLVLPGTSRPIETSLDHKGATNAAKLGYSLYTTAQELDIPHEALTPDNLHPTIAAYLTHQATLLHTLETPLDGTTYSWLSGTFQDGSRAPRGYWYSVDGQVRVYWDVVGYRDGGLGVRLPVWGNEL